MSKVKIQGNASGTGVLTIEAPNTNNDRTLTLPDSAGEIITSSTIGSNMPVGSVIQTVTNSSTTQYSWTDGSSQIVISTSITVEQGNKVLISYNVPISLTGISTNTWASMCFLSIMQNSNELYPLEHNGFNGVPSGLTHRVWNETGQYLTDALSAGTYTYGFRIDPYRTDVTCTVSRTPRKREIILQEIQQ